MIIPSVLQMKKLDTEVKLPKVIQLCQNSKTNPGQLAAKPSFLLYNKQFSSCSQDSRENQRLLGEAEEMGKV